MIPPHALLLELHRAAPETTLSVTVADLVALAGERPEGPEELSTVTAERFVGRTSKWWREHAPKVQAWWRRTHPAAQGEGAYLDEKGKWRFLNTAARAYLAELRRRADLPAASSTLPRGRTRRGPRRT